MGWRSWRAKGDQRVGHPGQRQALAGVAVGGGGPGTDRLGRRGAAGRQGIGPAATEILHDGFHGAVDLEALPNQIPERDERAPEAFVKADRVALEPVGQGDQGEEADEEREQLGEREVGTQRGWRRLSSRKHPAKLKG